MDGIFAKIGGRKYFYVLTCMALSWIAFFLKRIGFQELTVFLGAIGGGYFAANTVAKWSPEQNK